MWRRLFPLMVPCLMLAFEPSSAQETLSKRIARIGEAQSYSHPDLDEDRKGFEKALSDSGLKEGVNVTYLRQNAQNDRANAKAIAKKFLDSKLDLIHSIATLTSQTVVRDLPNTPIVFSSVTDPVGAKLVHPKGASVKGPESNVTGVSDRWPTSLQFEMHTRFFPKAKKWGTLYHGGDLFSLGHIREMRRVSKKLGIELIEVTITSPSEIPQAAQFLAGKVHAVHIPYDRMVLSGFEEIVKVCNEKKIPLFCGDAASVSRGAMAAYGLDYFNIGYSAGKKASKILSGEKPGDIPWETGGKFILLVSEKAAKAQGAVIPPELLKKADKIIWN